MTNTRFRPAAESDSHRLVNQADVVAGAVIEMVRRCKVLHGDYYPTTEIVIDVFPEYHVTNGVAHVPYFILGSKHRQRHFVLLSSLLGHDENGTEQINYWVRRHTSLPRKEPRTTA